MLSVTTSLYDKQVNSGVVGGLIWHNAFEFTAMKAARVYHTTCSLHHNVLVILSLAH